MFITPVVRGSRRGKKTLTFQPEILKTRYLVCYFLLKLSRAGNAPLALKQHGGTNIIEVTGLELWHVQPEVHFDGGRLGFA